MTQPPTLPAGLSEPKKLNTPGKFIGRMLLGCCLGIGSIIASGYLADVTNWNWGIMILPPLLALGLALFIALRLRRHGYLTGVILAPFFAAGTAAAIFLIMWRIYGGAYLTGR